MNLLENIEDKISEAEDGKWSTEEVKAASVEFEKLYRDFTGQDNSVKSIIDKHQDLIWNHHEAQPTLVLKICFTMLIAYLDLVKSKTTRIHLIA